MSEATVSEEQVLHNELSFEINQELIHLMKRIIEMQQENKQLKEKINTYENPEDLTLMFMYCDEKAKDKIKQLKEVIVEVREYIKGFDIERLHETCEHNLAEVLEYLLQILDKGVKNVQGSMEI